MMNEESNTKENISLWHELCSNIENDVTSLMVLTYYGIHWETT